MTRPDRNHLTSERHLSVVVDLRDAYTGDRPLKNPRVTLADRPERFTQNLSGYFVLTDFPTDASLGAIEVETGDYYLPETRIIEEAALEDPPLVVEIALLPAPAYPFPADATLVRGTVSDPGDGESGTPLSGVELTVHAAGDGTDDDEDDETDAEAVLGRGRSTNGGEYVVYFDGLTPETVANHYADEGDDRRDGRVVHVNGERPVIRAFDAEMDRETSTEVAVTLGTVTTQDISF